MRSLHPLAVLPSLLLVGVALAGCSSTPGATTPEATTPTASAPPHWSYEGASGPENWAGISDDFADCEAGMEQSPVALESGAVQQADDLAIEYGVVVDDIVNTGHTIQMNTEPGAVLDYDGDQYELVQMHFHDPSEHTVDGEHAPAEFHFVHQNADGELLVLGVFAEVGEHNTAWDPFITATETGEGDHVEGEIDVASLLPASLKHFAYAGSLTTPPCSEGVQWIVLETPVQIGQDQLDRITAAYAGNNRPTQPLGDREVSQDE